MFLLGLVFNIKVSVDGCASILVTDRSPSKQGTSHYAQDVARLVRYKITVPQVNVHVYNNLDA